MPVLINTATGAKAPLGRVRSFEDLRARAAAEFGDGELCFAAVDSDQDDGELGWVEVASTGNKRLAPIETDADLVSALSCLVQEILVHGASGELRPMTPQVGGTATDAPPPNSPVVFTL